MKTESESKSKRNLKFLWATTVFKAANECSMKYVQQTTFECGLSVLLDLLKVESAGFWVESQSQCAQYTRVNEGEWEKLSRAATIAAQTQRGMKQYLEDTSFTCWKSGVRFLSFSQIKTWCCGADECIHIARAISYDQRWRVYKRWWKFCRLHLSLTSLVFVFWERGTTDGNIPSVAFLQRWAVTWEMVSPL